VKSALGWPNWIRQALYHDSSKLMSTPNTSYPRRCSEERIREHINEGQDLLNYEDIKRMVSLIKILTTFMVQLCVIWVRIKHCWLIICFRISLHLFVVSEYYLCCQGLLNQLVCFSMYGFIDLYSYPCIFRASHIT